MTAMHRTQGTLRAPLGALQNTLFPPEAAWTAPRLVDLPQDWSVYERIAVDVETHDKDLTTLGPGVRRGATIVGVCLGFEQGETSRGFYLPIRHLGGDNMDEGPAAILKYVADQAAKYRGEVVGAKLDYDMDFLAQENAVFRQAKAFKDVLVAEPLIDELQFTYGLDAVLKRHGLEPKDEAVLRQAIIDFGLDPKHPKRDMHKLPGRFVGVYGERDVTAPLELLRRQEAIIASQDLDRVWAMEQAVTPVLVKMRRRGVAVDLDRLDEIERYAMKEEGEAWDEIYRLTGVRIKVGDAMKAEVVARALDAVEIVPPRTENGGPSITKDWLEALDHPTGMVIRKARRMSQLRTTFVASIRHHQVRGRVHCTFNQIVRQKDEENDTEGAAYGRLSCVDPNLQQQPIRDKEIGKKWRSIYRADEGGFWCQPDYSQQEPRLTLHFAVASGAERLGRVAHENAVGSAQAWWADPSIDDHTAFTKMVHGDDIVDHEDFKKTRDDCKQIKLGIVYGMGGPKLCRKIGLPTKTIAHSKTGRWIEVAGDEGQALLDKVDQRAPYLRATADAVSKIAKQRGYVMTLSGRRCRFPKDQFGNYEWTHKALNRVIQGSAADQTKMAMVELDKAGYALQLQVHDEFDLTIGDPSEGRRIAEIMEGCVKLNVPSKVDVGIGPSWGEVVE